jgi:hypothetical protein
MFKAAVSVKGERLLYSFNMRSTHFSIMNSWCQ